MLLAIYRTATYLAYLMLYPYGRLRAAFGSRLWRGRLGLVEERAGHPDVWIHASSVGEVRVISYLIDYLKRRRPELQVWATTMTAAGQGTAESLIGDAARVSFFPLDAAPSVRRTLDAVRPRMIVIAETEIWPNLIMEASRRGIPIVLVNARMSARSFARYRRITALMRSLLGRYDRFFLKSIEDAERYGSFDIEQKRLEVVGDMKFDAPLPDRSSETRRLIRERIGVHEDAPLMVAGSTRSGEEAMLLHLFGQVSDSFDGFVLVIAPRHVERAGELTRLMQDKSIPYSILGQAETTDMSSGRCILVDRVGLLNELYIAADVAFVGGTLVDVGGHNLLEPVWAGTPALYGPYLGNV